MTDFAKSAKTSTALTRRDVAILAIILVAAAFLRFYHLADPSLWMDEIWSIEMAMGRGSAHDHLPLNVIHDDQLDLTGLAGAAPSWSIVTHLSGVTHPPLYFVLLRWWIDLFGNGPFAVRSLSVLFSLVAVAVFFDLARFLHGTRIALLAAAICGLAIGQIEFAQEARGYSMFIFFALCAGDALIRIELLGVSHRRLIALAASMVATALVHYLCVGALVALAIYAAVRLRGRDRIRAGAAFVASAIVILIVWIPLFLRQKDTLPSLAPTFLRETHPAAHGQATLYRLIGLPCEFFFGESRAAAMSPRVIVSIFVLALVLPLVRLYWRRDLLLWIFWGWGALAFVAAMDLAHQTMLLRYLRYTILASPAIYAVIAAFDWPRRAIFRDALALAAIVLLGITAVQRGIDGVSPKEDWQTLASELDASAGPNDLLVFFNNDPWMSAGTWYLGFKYYAPDSHRPWLVLDRPADEKVLQQLSSRKLLWLVGPFPEMQGPRILPGWIPAYSQEQTSAGAFCPMIPRGLVVPNPGHS